MQRTRSFPCNRHVLIAGMVLVLLGTTGSEAQEKGSTSNSLARYVPKDNLLIYVEFEGLGAHEDAWKKTAAYKILNDTPTGAMLEQIGSQLVDKLGALDPTGKSANKGQEFVAVIKHVARSGFVFARVSNPQNSSKPFDILVIREAFKDKTIRGILAKSLAEMNAPNTKPQSVVRVGHKVVTGLNSTGTGFAWWVEETKKEDIVQVFPSVEAADVVLETLDGKRPSAVELPRRVEGLNSGDGFTPIGLAFVDPVLFQTQRILNPSLVDDLARFDFRWGFQDNALMSITRIVTKGPRRGILALFDGPAFDKSKLSLMPDSVGEFTVTSFDLKTMLEQSVAVAKNFKPDAEEQVNKFVDSIKTSTKLRLKEDILPHLGPRVTFFTVPTKAGTKSTAATGWLGNLMTSLGSEQVPKAALVFDIDDPAAFGKVLDQVMVAVNKELKARAAKSGGADTVPTKGGRSRSPSVPSIEFRLMPGDNKTYVLTVPPELSSQYPTSFRPAIKVGAKQAVIGVTSEVARVVMETKGTWNAPGNISPAMQGLSSKLKFLNVTDPRDSLPGLLAALPGNLQKGINTAIQLAMNPAVPGATTPPANGAASAPPGSVAVPNPNSVSGGPGRGRRPGTPEPGMQPGAPGPTPNSAAMTPATVVLQVDAAMLPSADAIKALLFPSVLAVEVNDEEIRIMTRGAFPSLPDTSKLAAIWQLASPWMGQVGFPGVTPPAASKPDPSSPTPPPTNLAAPTPKSSSPRGGRATAEPS